MKKYSLNLEVVIPGKASSSKWSEEQQQGLERYLKKIKISVLAEDFNKAHIKAGEIIRDLVDKETKDPDRAQQTHFSFKVTGIEEVSL